MGAAVSPQQGPVPEVHGLPVGNQGWKVSQGLQVVRETLNSANWLEKGNEIFTWALQRSDPSGKDWEWATVAN